MTEPVVYVVVVNWNRWDDTAACVASALAGEYSNLRVVVIDNGSTVGSGAVLQNRRSDVEIIHNATNLGFASGANRGIERALAGGADYIFTLNNDTIVERRCVSELVVAAEQDRSVGIVGPKICYLDPPNRIWFAGADRDRWTLSLLRFGKGAPDGPEFDRPREVSYLCAGAMLVRRDVFARAGLFDPEYFMYYEDCDFCMRVRAEGYRLTYVPTARVWHRVAASTGGEGSPLEHYYRACSVFRFLRQHTRGPHRAVLMTTRAIYIALKVAYYQSLGQSEVARALGRGLRDGLSGKSCMMRYRDARVA